MYKSDKKIYFNKFIKIKKSELPLQLDLDKTFV